MAIIRSQQLDLSSITGSLLGTASYALNAATASYAAATTPSSFIVTGSIVAEVLPTGTVFQLRSGSQQLFSVDDQGAVNITSSANEVFLIKNVTNNTILTVSQSGVVVLSTQSTELTGFAPNGGMYFTSSSFFVGLD